MVSLDDLNDFVLLHIFEYLDVISLTRMQMISRHLFVAAYRVLSNSPSIITKSGISPRSFKSILDGLTSTPTFALVVGERMNQKLSNFVSALQTSLPKSTHVILAKCTGVLKCPIVPAETSSSGKSLRKRAVDEDNADSSTEPSSIGDYTVFMASLPDTQCSSFYVRVCESTAPAITDESLRAYGLQDVDQEWELFLVFASPTPFIGEFIAGLQLR